jgi:ABC-type multidrug transport system fused ATPase/permease subunit|tara:strand:+ start:27454 stop:29238 length:1785 start_codon:yes stop_codon:yes gene_type:complete
VARKNVHSTFRLAKRAFGQYKLQIAVLTGLGFLSGILEAIGVNALIPLFSFFTEGETGGTDFISQTIEKLFLFFDVSFTLPTLLIFIVILFFAKALAILLFNYVKIRIRADYEQQTRNKLFGTTLVSTWPYLLKQKLGYLHTVIMTDAQLSAKLLWMVSDTIMVVTSLAMYLLVAVNISAKVTAVTLIIGVAVFIILRPIIRRTRAVSKKTALLNKEVARTVNESVLGLKTIKAMFLENVFSGGGEEHFKKLKSYQIRTSMLGTLSTVFIQPISVLFISGVFAFFFYSDQGFSFAAVAALIYLIHRIFSYIQLLQSNANSINNLIPYLQEVLKYQDEAKENKEEDSAVGDFVFDTSLSFDTVAFSYQESDSVLNNISLDIQKGDMIGLIGLSGAGKTTMFDLLLRLLTPSSGTIKLDGKNIQDIRLSSWRKNVGYVSQDLFLANDTIANNIRFYDSSISDKDIKEAAKMAYIHDFIEGLPNKFDTVVGERGIRLSTGQRQRIAIARALVRKPTILLLDEATSALDNESEVEIQKAVETLKGKTTVIVIAHRLSTVVNSDKLLVLEEGRIIEEGKPKDLLKDKESYFYKMYNIRG